MQIKFESLSKFGDVIEKMFNYKSGALVVSSTGLAAVIEFIANGEFMGVSTAFIVLISVMYLVDMFTGILASRSEGEKVKSSKLGYTFIKFLALYLWIWLSYQIQKVIGEVSWLQFFVSAISTFPLVLVALREFISIGENVERRYGHRPYIFRLVEKVFDVIESLLMKRIEANDVTK